MQSLLHARQWSANTRLDDANELTLVTYSSAMLLGMRTISVARVLNASLIMARSAFWSGGAPDWSRGVLDPAYPGVGDGLVDGHSAPDPLACVETLSVRRRFED